MNKETLILKLNQLGFIKPTRIQEESINVIGKQNALLISPTGTGKTLAYLLPLLERIDKDKDMVQALIIVPTNELANQVFEVLNTLNTEVTYRRLSTHEEKSRIIRSLEHRQPQIAITTPNRLLDLAVNENVLKTYTASYIILDEADMLFDLDFMMQLDPVFSKVDAHIYSYSATMPKHLIAWVNKYFGNSQTINLTDEVTLNLEHRLIMGTSPKHYRFTSLLEHLNPYLCFIFVSKNEDIDPLYQELLDHGYKVTRLTSKIPLRQRRNILDEIKTLKYQYVISSDIGSRGIDIEGISHIINYDLPYKNEFYIHRSGRSGRMGMHGIVYSFYEDKYSRKFSNIEKYGIRFSKYQLKNGIPVLIEEKKKGLSEDEIQAIRSVKKPTRVKPGYKKKNKQKIEKALKEARREKRGKRR